MEAVQEWQVTSSKPDLKEGVFAPDCHFEEDFPAGHGSFLWGVHLPSSRTEGSLKPEVQHSPMTTLFMSIKKRLW